VRVWSRIWNSICRNWLAPGEPETGHNQIDDLTEIKKAVEEMATAYIPKWMTRNWLIGLFTV